MVQIARRNSIGDALARAADLHGDRQALLFGDRRWSYSRLFAAGQAAGRGLLAQGLRPGDRVVAYGRNSDSYLLAWLGCAFSGLVHVPVNYALNPAELDYISRQCGASLVLHDAGLRAPEAVPGIPLDAMLSWVDGPGMAPEFPEAEALAQILYTSGTTARPKGAMMTHAALLAEYASCTIGLDFRPGDRVLAALPLYHAAQMHAFLMPQLLIGATIVLLESAAPEACLAAIAGHRLTSFFAPPTLWIGLLRHPAFAGTDLGSLRKIYYGASVMPVAVLRELQERLPGAGAYNAYGQSEIGPVATILRPEEHELRPASAGRPAYNVATRVVDEAMRDLAPGAQGEIVHRSPQLLTGYWEKPEETAAAFRGGWFHSGDVGYFDEAGYLFVVDRLKDVIKTGGVAVAGREIEEVLFSHPAVLEAAVIGLADAKWIEAVTAVVVLRDGVTVEAGELLVFARDRLAPFKVPKRVLFVAELPKNTAGKVLKRELRARFSQ